MLMKMGLALAKLMPLEIQIDMVYQALERHKTTGEPLEDEAKFAIITLGMALLTEDEPLERVFELADEAELHTKEDLTSQEAGQIIDEALDRVNKGK